MKGIIQLPGDKSLSHRVAMLASVAEGPCKITNFNKGADCAATLNCLREVGAIIHDGLIIEPAPMRAPAHPLDCGNSGSTIRMLTGLLAGQDVPATLIGDVSLLRRPMRRVAEPLRQMGARVFLRDEEFAPVILQDGVKRAIAYQMPLSSAQVKSAILFAGLRFPGTRVMENIPSRDHTERLFDLLQVSSRQSRHLAPVPAFEYLVPGDPSAAAFFAVGALLQPGSEILFRGMLMNPNRITYMRKLQQCGAHIEVSGRTLLQNELIADVKVFGGNALKPIVIQPEEVAGVIDEIPALALLGTKCGFQVSGAAELRNKESDRIDAMCANLDALGIYVEQWEDGFRVEPGRLLDGMANTYGDHRIAMSFAVAGIELDDAECISVSFPEFFDILNSITR